MGALSGFYLSVHKAAEWIDILIIEIWRSNMKCFIRTGIVAIGALGFFAGAAWAEGPQFMPPHGMFKVEVDPNTNKIFSNKGVGIFSTGAIFFNQDGHTILAQNHRVPISDPPELNIGIREDDGTGVSPTAVRPAANSALVRTDDPGFRSFIDEPTSFPDGYTLSVNLHNSLRFWNGAGWGTPLNGEQLEVADPNDLDDFNNPVARVTYTESTSGEIGTIPLQETELPNFPIHNHLFYALSRADNGMPNMGAYMIELNLEAQQTFGSGGPVLQDSDPLFIIFNNGLDAGGFSAAVSGAVPEPSTAAIVTAIGLGVIALRRHRRFRA